LNAKDTGTSRKKEREREGEREKEGEIGIGKSRPSFLLAGRATAYRRRQKNQATKSNPDTAEYCIHCVCRLHWQASLHYV